MLTYLENTYINIVKMSNYYFNKIDFVKNCGTVKIFGIGKLGPK